MSGTSVSISVASLRRALFGVVILSAAAGLALVAVRQGDGFDFKAVLTRGVGDEIDRSTYQALFLTGGQVYFGKLSPHGYEYFLLDDVYYLSPSEGREGPASPPPGQLVKRGNELHGPRDPMIVPTRTVLFIENLRPDGEVMVAIRRFKAGEPPSATPRPAASPAAPVSSAPTARPSPTPTR